VQTPRPAAARSRWLIWDPHEKLWTWTTVGAVRRVFGDNPLGRGILGAVVTADSVLLLTRVLARRVQLVAAGEGRAPSGTDPRPRVLYVDCGVHKEGRQIRAVHAWLGDRYDLTIVGIEAGSEHVEDARSALADVGGVELRTTRGRPSACTPPAGSDGARATRCSPHVAVATRTSRRPG